MLTLKAVLISTKCLLQIQRLKIFLKDSSMNVVLSLSLILKVIYFCKYDKQGLFNDVSYAVEICEQAMISAKITSNYDV